MASVTAEPLAGSAAAPAGNRQTAAEPQAGIAVRSRCLALLPLLQTVLLLIWVVVPADGWQAGRASSGPIPAEVMQQLARPEIFSDGIVAISEFVFQAGPALIHLQDGVLYPAMPIAGRPVELVFIGRGSFELHPDDAIEGGQLKLFTGSESLQEPFDRAVFVLALDAAVQAALGHGRKLELKPEEWLWSESLLAAWHDSPERALLDVEARILGDALGDPLAGAFFCGSFHGRRLGTFLYAVDPLAHEQVSLGRLVKPELDRDQRRLARSRLTHAQRQGKLIGLDVSDLGRWVTWVSCALHDADGKQQHGTHGVGARHYSHDITIDRHAPEMRAVTRLSLAVTVSGLRTVTLSLHSDLTPLAVRDESGRVLPYLRSRGELTVVLPQPSRAETLMILEVEYEARPFHLEGGRRFSLRQPLGWHPRVIDSDRATFDATLRWPKGLDLAANGRVDDGGVTDDGRRWQRRSLDIPCTGFSFEVGDFEILERTSGHVVVTVAVDRAGRKVGDDLTHDLFATIQDALAYFEQIFGPYPLDRLEVVTSPRSYSQGLLGFITLSTSSLRDLGEWGAVLGMIDRRTVIAHEIAHQWWGNLVGWRSYRDLWISEAMANYAALLYSRHRLQQPGQPRVWRGPTTGWNRWLLSTLGGQPVESLGPVVLGTRLKEGFSRRAYEAIVYKKGAIILDTLARLFTEDDFLRILQGIVRTSSRRTISTEEFLQQVEALSGLDLGWFARQYVYGTGMPEVFYSYRAVQEEDGSWTVLGVCRQYSPYHYQYRVERLPDGHLDVARSAVRHLDVSHSILVVPFRLEIRGPETTPATLVGGGPQGQIITGHVALRGTETTFRIASPTRPLALELDHRREVFGRFFCETCWPRQTKLTHALDLEAAGRRQEAETMLLDALEQPMAATLDGPQDADKDLAWRARTLDVQIRLSLARLYLDLDRLDDASQQLDLGRNLMTRGDRWQFEKDLAAVEARLELARGRAERAFALISEALRERRYARSGETWALLAVAALASGNHDEVGQAQAKAQEQGVDMTALREG